MSKSSDAANRCFQCLSTYRVTEIAPGVLCCNGFCRKRYLLGVAGVAASKAVEDERKDREEKAKADIEKMADFKAGLETGALKNAEKVKIVEKEATKPEEDRYKVGDYCIALYTEDCLRYEAVIREVKADDSGRKYACVEFLGYGNTQNVWMEDLIPSKGDVYRYDQIRVTENFRKPLPDWTVGETCWAIDDGLKLFRQAVILLLYADLERKASIQFKHSGAVVDRSLYHLEKLDKTEEMEAVNKRYSDPNATLTLTTEKKAEPKKEPEAAAASVDGSEKAGEAVAKTEMEAVNKRYSDPNATLTTDKKAEQKKEPEAAAARVDSNEKADEAVAKTEEMEAVNKRYSDPNAMLITDQKAEPKKEPEAAAASLDSNEKAGKAVAKTEKVEAVNKRYSDLNATLITDQKAEPKKEPEAAAARLDNSEKADEDEAVSKTEEIEAINKRLTAALTTDLKVGQKVEPEAAAASVDSSDVTMIGSGRTEETPTVSKVDGARASSPTEYVDLEAKYRDLEAKHRDLETSYEKTKAATALMDKELEKKRVQVAALSQTLETAKGIFRMMEF